MSSALDLISTALDRRAVGAIGQQLGAEDGAVQHAVAAALPMLLSGLAQNTSRSGGAEALAGALDRDHDGSILDDVSGFLGRGEAASADGAGILRHVLGNREPQAVEAVSRSSGLDAASAGKLLSMIAPLVLAALGRQKQQQGLDPRRLADLLGQERERVAREQPQAMAIIGQLLDQDGDGSVADEVAEIGKSLLGSLFRR